MTGRVRVDVVVDLGAVLGEGPVWDARSQRLLWVDIIGCKIHATEPRSGETETMSTELRVGAAVPRTGRGVLAAVADGFVIIGDGPTRRLAELPDARPGLRFNDGKCDPAGRFWGGTITDDEVDGAAACYRLDVDGRVTRMFDRVTVSNGLAWSPDGSTMFYIDTPTRRIDAFTFDVESGSISDRRVVVRIPAGAGYPDGMTIDAEGGLWVALWDGAAVHRYVDGDLDRVVELPVRRPTSCAFGGHDLDELYVTSASVGLGRRGRRPRLAGALFRLDPGVAGLPPVPFAG